MPNAILPADATITGIVDTLNRPHHYVQNVFTHMWSCKKQFGNASVRIGITGEGKAPHYKIEYQRDSGGIATFGIYRGLGHRPFEDLGSIDFIVLSDDPAEITEVATEIAKRETPEHPDHFVKVFSWSAQATTFEKIGALRMELQKRRR